MNKRIAGIFVCMILLFCSMAAGAATMKVTATKVSGTVEVKSGASGWKAVKDGDAIAVGAQVRTGAGASCLLKWGGGNVVKVGPSTTLSVDQAEKTAAGDEKSKVSLKDGKVSAHAKKLATGQSSFNIQTPTAVAGVRGTDILAEISEGNVTFGVSDGQLELTVGGETFVLEDGFLVNVDADGEFTEPIAIPQEMQQQLKIEFDAIKQEAASDESAGGDDEQASDDEDADGDDENADSEDDGADLEEVGDAGDSIDDILDNEVNSDIVDEAGTDYITGEIEVIIQLQGQY